MIFRQSKESLLHFFTVSSIMVKSEIGLTVHKMSFTELLRTSITSCNVSILHRKSGKYDENFVILSSLNLNL